MEGEPAAALRGAGSAWVLWWEHRVELPVCAQGRAAYAVEHDADDSAGLGVEGQ